MKKSSSRRLTITAILTAFGILIPLIMPVKVVIGPASFTLASHVPLFLAIFISPFVTILVGLGTAFGFLLAGFPIVIVLRALSHLIFALLAAIVIKRYPNLLQKPIRCFIFALLVNLLHGLAEFVVVYLLTVTSTSSLAYVLSLLSLIGLGSLIHGMIDFYLALLIWRLLKDRLGLSLSLEK
ncbi:hypothetical protein [Streptococcus loxodontisalivarius]|uniref:Niacin transporter n=1 Tax=Streptococcus loxodontisalivarius TaxID=1349415 RepID=A0ABS2PV59_9STRE|nr:hypothetical protein [Streptococcus loxodontisalivarius]MBM7643177.1 niacin transporter [Streptococcus loxodontisalivarius]